MGTACRTRRCGELFAAATEETIGADHPARQPQFGPSRAKTRIEFAFGTGLQDMELKVEVCERAAFGGFRLRARQMGLVGLTSRAMMVAVGTNSCSSSSRFGPTSTLSVVTPVRLPPGRLRLATRPASTGSAPV